MSPTITAKKYNNKNRAVENIIIEHHFHSKVNCFDNLLVDTVHYKKQESRKFGDGLKTHPSPFIERF